MSTFLADAIERGDVTTATVGKQPRKLEAFLKDWWKATVAQAGADKAALDLPRDARRGAWSRSTATISASLHERLRSSWTDDPIARLVTGMRRVVAGSDEDGYAFAHPRFRSYVRRFPEIAPYDAQLLAYCEGWRGQSRRYALTYGIRHLAQAQRHDRLIETVLDEEFQAEQKQVLGSIQQTLTDLGTAIRAGCDHDRFLDVLRCATSYRRLVQTEGVARAVFSRVRERRFDAAGDAVRIRPQDEQRMGDRPARVLDLGGCSRRRARRGRVVDRRFGTSAGTTRPRLVTPRRRFVRRVDCECRRHGRVDCSGNRGRRGAGRPGCSRG